MECSADTVPPLVSVIVPIYNVEKFLNRCVESIVAQTWKNLQIVLVDDGSPDKCPELCDQWAERDRRIRVVHKPNGGLSSARNAGMEAASGDYVLFVDSDDWIETDTVEKLLHTAVEYKVPYVRFNFVYAGNPNIPDGTPYYFQPERRISGGYYDKARIREEIFPRLFCTRNLLMGSIVSVWGGFYEREFLLKHNMRFREDVKYSEDSIFSAEVVYHLDSFYYLDSFKCYHYFYNSTSITKSFRKDRWDAAKALMICFEEFAKAATDYDFSAQVKLKGIFCILNGLGQRRALKGFRQKRDYCRDIINDPVTRKYIKYFLQADSTWKMKIYLAAIYFKLPSVVALI